MSRCVMFSTSMPAHGDAASCFCRLDKRRPRAFTPMPFLAVDLPSTSTSAISDRTPSALRGKLGIRGMQLGRERSIGLSWMEVIARRGRAIFCILTSKVCTSSTAHGAALVLEGSRGGRRRVRWRGKRREEGVLVLAPGFSGPQRSAGTGPRGDRRARCRSIEARAPGWAHVPDIEDLDDP
ncbi:hypothetical protein DFH09DRAFT_485056 [Mycena vulgaris]|nr:hypothetical protein DFH09DRAFT_485056 [Mycena vulgaris]